jgi:hypothetical protein
VIITNFYRPDGQPNQSYQQMLVVEIGDKIVDKFCQAGEFRIKKLGKFYGKKAVFNKRGNR